MMKEKDLIQKPEGGDLMNSNLIHSKYSIIEKELLNFSKEVHKRLISSETMSLYSHLPKKYISSEIKLGKELNSREAMVLALIVNHLDPLLKYNIILELEEICYKFKYEGQWSKVNSIIQISEDVDKIFYILKIENISGRELFGNYLGLIPKVLEKRILFHFKSKKVNKPQRKRGYNDHGSQRPNHKWLPKKIQDSPNPIKEDRRGINLEIRDLQLQEKKKPESTSTILPQKGEIVNEKQTTSPSSGNDRRKDSAS